MRFNRLAGSIPIFVLASSFADAAFVPSRPSTSGVSHHNINDEVVVPPSLPHKIKRLPAAPLYLKKGGTKKKKVKSNLIAVNKLAFRNYEVLEKWEAGVSLVGTEVKSIRDGKMNIRDGFVKPSKNGRSCTLMNVHIGKHASAGEFFQHEERRPRDLLLHKQESRKLLQRTDRMPGMTIVPLRAYWSEGNRVKFEIGLCKGKDGRDKRADIKEREGKRETNRMIKNFNYS